MSVLTVSNAQEALSIEAAEAESALLAAKARQRWLGDHIRTQTHKLNDACALFAGHWTHITQAIILELGVSSATLDTLESFFSGLRALTTVHVSDEFTPAVHRLQQRGYRLLGKAAVVSYAGPMFRTQKAHVEVVDPANANEWIHTASTGFLCSEPRDREELEIGGVASEMAGVTRLLARVNGKPAAAAAMLMTDGTAILFCDSTVPRFRGAGLHKELIAARVQLAMRAGAGHIVATVQPGTASERNYHDCGFEHLYHRLTFRKP